jgi:hypothetical protein
MIGFSIGTVFVIFFFQNRGCAWLPGNRVKNNFLDKVLVLPESEVIKIEQLGLKHSDIFNFLHDGKVNFSESIKKQSVFPKAYIIEQEIKGKNIRLQFSLYEDSYIAPVHLLKEDEPAQSYETLSGTGRIIRVPRDSALVFIENTPRLACISSGLTEFSQKEIAAALLENGTIDFSKSNLMLPKAEHFISFTMRDSIYFRAKTIYFESRINFKDFYWENKLPCEN